MFFTMMYYQFKRLLRSKQTLFWSIVFPIILGTLFSFGFGDIMDETETFHAIPVAVVQDENADEIFLTVVDELSKEGDNKLLDITKCNKEQAEQLLTDEKISGYFIIGEETKLVVSQNGINQSTLKEIVDRFQRTQYVTSSIIKENPELLKNPDEIQKITEQLIGGLQYVSERKLGSGEQDSMLGYFFALIAFTCMYGSLWGLDIVVALQGNISPLGARRCVAPTNKLKLLLADGLSAFCVHMAEIFLVIVYLIYVLGVDFGNHLSYVMLSSVFGSMIGICMGIFIGAAVKGTEKTKEAVVLSVSMLFSFCSGLMIVSMPHIIEEHFPLFNRINPCTLLVNSFMSLDIYSDKTKYFECLINMAVLSAILLVASFLVMRRKKYASI